MNKTQHAFSVIAIIFVLLSACGKPKGSFVFKDEFDNRYKTIQGEPEFEQGRRFEWAYKFDKRYGKRTFGVVTLRKELVWVETERRSAAIDGASTVIYGTLAELAPGRYKIIITERNDIIDEKEFSVFAGEDDDDDFDRD